MRPRRRTPRSSDETCSHRFGLAAGLATRTGGQLWVVGGTALNYEGLGISMMSSHLVLSVGGLLTLIGLASLARLQARDNGRASLAIRRSRLLGASFLAIGGLGILNVFFLMGPFEGTETEFVGPVLLPILVGFGWTAVRYALWSSEANARIGAQLEVTHH